MNNYYNYGHFRHALPIFFAVCFLILLSIGNAFSQSFPAGFNRVRIIQGKMPSPTAFAFAPDGRIFLAEQSGKIRIIKDGRFTDQSFYELTVQATGGRGLLGMTIDPEFDTHPYIYVFYTIPDGTKNRVSRLTANGDLAVPNSETVIFETGQIGSSDTHHGGQLRFGPDKKLYIAMGENQISQEAQNMDSYKGKIIRINRDGSVPSGNPYTSGSEQKKRIWSSGLRNPYTFDIQPGTGKIFVNDVGEASWEEINDATVAGRNFGWPLAEGNSNNSNFTDPAYAYAHGEGNMKGCAVTGGTFFNPTTTNYPSNYFGKYFFVDFCNNWINYIDSSNPGEASLFGTDVGERVVYMETGPDGNIYYLTRSGPATLYKIVYTEEQVPHILNQPENVSVSAGQSVSFSVSASGTAPLQYQWQKNGVDIPNANSATLSIQNVSSADAGNYRVKVSNDYGQATSNAATLEVTGFNGNPVAKITSPKEGSYYYGDQTIEFSGTATDPEDGVLPASAFTWEIEFHHDTHSHDGPPVASGTRDGSFTIPNVGETSSNVWYRIYLRVKDSQGLEGVDYVEIFPRKTTMRFKTQPSGLKVTVDGQPFQTTGTIKGVEGILRTIGAISPQTKDGKTYVFDKWEHGGSAQQTIVTPKDYTTYVAVFKESSEPPANDLPAPWEQTDIGDIVTAGDASFENNIFTVSGAGSDIWGTSDEFHYVYQELGYEGEIIGRVISLDPTDDFARAGFMIRDELTEESRYGGIFITPNEGIWFQRRKANGEETTYKNRSNKIPRWLKLTKVGKEVTGYKSNDGVDWLKVGSMNLNSSGTLYIGMAVCSYSATNLTTAEFESVVVNEGNPAARTANAIAKKLQEKRDLEQERLAPEENAISFSPVPADKQLQISNLTSSQNQEIIILDVTGRQFTATMIEHGSHGFTLDTSRLPNGVYTIFIQNEEKAIYKRLIIKH